MGSQSKINLAYIAGFLDGDGSLMLQVKKRRDGASKKRIMATICLYQDTRHEKTLHWIRKIFGIGYLSRRNDGMSELRINGFDQVRKILIALLPFIRFKKAQARSLLRATRMLSGKKLSEFRHNELKKLVDCILVIQQHNYASRKKRTREEFIKILDLTP